MNALACLGIVVGCAPAALVAAARFADVDGDGYGSHGVTPVHFGLGEAGKLPVDVTCLAREGRVRKRIDAVGPGAWTGQAPFAQAD